MLLNRNMQFILRVSPYCLYVYLTTDLLTRRNINVATKPLYWVEASVLGSAQTKNFRFYDFLSYYIESEQVRQYVYQCKKAREIQW